ncbi:TRAP transporter small permease subunit [Alcaligenes ammonioxydans]|jgi:TRAP-type mannitol/chloroaromatic compound transport system permease small subunit|uniref:TRAP transporter small permease protein n=1 Tax=Alcaligenes ammonioxydans TaxID=2582914 RepID=A0ABX8STQ5_9BURK|nr:TRAP transporter small permease subunit [Alcaligenes ammonioxydans]EJC61606.1 TRAP transporter, DctQ family protein [Alcaligenes faecalis subsp. faecalis NCIB 8687]QBH20226.1 TRAP transporter small permease subunit [Alcaligenes faecalis]MCH1879434.1 TRAP transporter small permease subunit [Alcaligenes ammonioxydans]QXX78263.1 TRAP transporter small permease subunit [Alcaligenes ammonioxydans]WGQ36406.1 TRAP transporter small permease subunit [Alcaligenes faecalis]
MLQPISKLIDLIALASARLAELAAAILVTAMVWEVFARYVLHAPTVWAFDVAYMMNGAIFLLGTAWVMRQNEHISIDVVRKHLPKSFARISDLVLYLLVLFPLFAVLSKVSIHKAWMAWKLNEVEMVSPWAPLMWPFYACIALGLIAFTLQLLAHGVRCAAKQAGPEHTEVTP